MSYEVEVRTLERTDTAVVRDTVPWAAIAETVSRAYGEIFSYLPAHGIAATGIVYGRYMPQGDRVAIEAGAAVAAPITGEGRVQPGELPGGDAAVCLHVGPYDAVPKAYEAAQSWMQANGRTAAGAPWEVYLTPPEEQPPRTEVVFPLARD